MILFCHLSIIYYKSKNNFYTRFLFCPLKQNFYHMFVVTYEEEVVNASFLLVRDMNNAIKQENEFWDMTTFFNSTSY